MTIVSIAIQKGGSGKTTTAFNVADELASMGQKVLLVDLDAQATLTYYSGIAIDNDISSVFDKGMPLENILQKINHNITLAPSSIDLSVTELTLTGRLGRENVLKKALQPVLKRFDYVLIDTPPSLGLLTVNALAASDMVISPVQPNAADIWGLQLFLQTIDNIKEIINPGITFAGVILTFFDKRLTLHQQAVSEIEASGIPIIGMVGRSVRIAEAAGEHLSLKRYERTNPQNENYRTIAERITKL